MKAPSPAERQRWIDRNAYYYASLGRLLQHLVPPGSTVLQAHAEVGQLISQLPDRACTGIDPRPEFVAHAASRHPHVIFKVLDAATQIPDGMFDYVVLSDVLGSLRDVQGTLSNLRAAMAPHSRLILTYYNYLWDPLLKLGEIAGLKMPQQHQNWLPMDALEGILRLADFEVVTKDHYLLVPRDAPLANTINRYVAPLPGVRNLCLVQYVVARPVPVPQRKEATCSVIVPCRNEAGTIAEVVERTPQMGSHTEIVFVEGHSRDDTLAACYRIQGERSDRDIKVVRQDGVGKGDAVRKGFDVAQGEALIILDADLSTPPEDLPKFYAALAEDKADVVIGTRLIYPMERDAMRFLNLIANRAFGQLFSYLIGQPITDTLCGTKALTRSAYQRIAAQRHRFGDIDPFGDFDLLLGGAGLNMRIVEVPVRYAARKYGDTNIDRFRHGLLLARMAWRALRRLRLVS